MSLLDPVFNPLKGSRVSAALMLTAALIAGPVFAADEAAKPSEQKPVCEQSTGTRVVRRPDKDGNCIAGPGQTVSREQLDATGTNNLADALARSVPSLTTTH